MAELKAASRNKLPAKSFGLPGKRAYPMADRSQMLDKGKLSPASAARIRAKANRILGKD